MSDSRERDHIFIRMIRKPLLSEYHSVRHPIICFSLDHVLTPKECTEWIAESEKIGFVPATIHSEVLSRKERFFDQCYMDHDTDKLTLLWNRIQDYLIDSEYGKPIGLNPRLRFLRYYPGNYFKPHYDAICTNIEGQESRLTLQLYLNDNFEGGETVFIGDHAKWKVPYQPKQGSVLVFNQELLHEGAFVRKGIKYSVRMDIMFSKE